MKEYTAFTGLMSIPVSQSSQNDMCKTMRQFSVVIAPAVSCLVSEGERVFLLPDHPVSVDITVYSQISGANK